MILESKEIFCLCGPKYVGFECILMFLENVQADAWQKEGEVHDVMQMNREARSGNAVKQGEPDNRFGQEAK